MFLFMQWLDYFHSAMVSLNGIFLPLHSSGTIHYLCNNNTAMHAIKDYSILDNSSPKTSEFCARHLNYVVVDIYLVIESPGI